MFSFSEVGFTDKKTGKSTCTSFKYLFGLGGKDNELSHRPLAGPYFFDRVVLSKVRLSGWQII